MAAPKKTPRLGKAVTAKAEERPAAAKAEEAGAEKSESSQRPPGPGRLVPLGLQLRHEAFDDGMACFRDHNETWYQKNMRPPPHCVNRAAAVGQDLRDRLVSCPGGLPRGRAVLFLGSRLGLVQ